MCERVIALREYSFKISGLELTTSLPKGIPKVLADGGQLQQVLLNLVLNAEQAMRGAPRRALSIAARAVPRINAVELRVSDSGHGIEHSSLSRIFDPFYTTRDVGEGTGLGLSICYGIVRDHGGQIAVDSRPLEGTTFTVLLPAILPEVAAQAVEILVAHPESTEREFITAAVRGWGYRPVVAATIEEAAELWRRPALRMAIVDRSFLSADLNTWHDRGGLDRSRPVRLILTSTASDDTELEPPRRDDAPAILITPVSLGPLNDAVQNVTNNDPLQAVINQEYA